MSSGERDTGTEPEPDKGSQRDREGDLSTGKAANSLTAVVIMNMLSKF